MHPASLNDLDVYMFGIPLIALLFFGYFRLDEVFTSRRDPSTPATRPAPVIDPEGSSMQTDPDGRPWDAKVRRHR